MKKKLSLKKKFLREIFKGLKRIYWFNYTKIKYFIFTFNFIIKKKKIIKKKISLLLPTKERSNKFKRMMDSLNHTILDKDRLELLLLLDENEKEGGKNRNPKHSCARLFLPSRPPIRNRIPTRFANSLEEYKKISRAFARFRWTFDILFGSY